MVFLVSVNCHEQKTPEVGCFLIVQEVIILRTLQFACLYEVLL